MISSTGTRRQLTHLALPVLIGAWSWLVYGQVLGMTMVHIWEPVFPDRDLFLIGLCATAVPLMIVAVAALSWLRAGPWWQQWALFVGGIVLAVLLKSYWRTGDFELARSILSRSVFITCVISSLLAFIFLSVLKNRLRPNNALEHSARGRTRASQSDEQGPRRPRAGAQRRR